jgi:hypothetical protein
MKTRTRVLSILAVAALVGGGLLVGQSVFRPAKGLFTAPPAKGLFTAPPAKGLFATPAAADTISTASNWTQVEFYAPTDSWRLDTTFVIQGEDSYSYVGLAACDDAGDPRNAVVEFGMAAIDGKFVLLMPANALAPALFPQSIRAGRLDAGWWLIPGIRPTAGTYTVSLTVRYDQGLYLHDREAAGYRVNFAIEKVSGDGHASALGFVIWAAPPVLATMGCVAEGHGRQANGFSVLPVAVVQHLP